MFIIHYFCSIQYLHNEQKESIQTVHKELTRAQPICLRYMEGLMKELEVMDISEVVYQSLSLKWCLFCREEGVLLWLRLLSIEITWQTSMFWLSNCPSQGSRTWRVSVFPSCRRSYCCCVVDVHCFFGRLLPKLVVSLLHPALLSSATWRSGMMLLGWDLAPTITLLRPSSSLSLALWTAPLFLSSLNVSIWSIFLNAALNFIQYYDWMTATKTLQT